MEVKGTKEAFVALINQRAVYKILGVDRSTVSGWKIRIESGEGISTDKMEEILLKAGSTYKNERIWTIPTPDTVDFKILTQDFHDEIKEAEVGSQIIVNYDRGMSETIVNNALNRQAMKLGCIVLRDDSKRPVVRYKFGY